MFKYRLQSYFYGRLAKEYWNKYYFNAQIYCAIARHNIVILKAHKLNYIFTNSNLQPVIKDVENFEEYSREMVKPEPLKNEPPMPVLADIGNILHILMVKNKLPCRVLSSIIA